MNMIKNIIKILVFIILFFILLTTVSFMMKPVSVDLKNIRGFYGEEKNSLDMVYIGGSASFVYYEPLKAYEDYGIVSYDYASNTIQCELYKYLIQEVLKYQNPEVILIDARSFQYREKDQPPTEVAYRNALTGTPFSVEKVKFIERYVKDTLKEETLSYHFDMIKYHTRYNEIEELDYFDYRTPLDMMKMKYKNPLKGFYFVPKVASIIKANYDTDEIVEPSEETLEILEELLDYLKTTDRKYLFIVSPYSEKIEHKKIFNFVEQKVIDAGFDFVDANEYDKLINIDYSIDFYNENHMNIFGADKYTKFLAEYLKSNYNLPDRREDENYASWNLLLENWHLEVDKTKKSIEKQIRSKK